MGQSFFHLHFCLIDEITQNVVAALKAALRFLWLFFKLDFPKATENVPTGVLVLSPWSWTFQTELHLETQTNSLETSQI